MLARRLPGLLLPPMTKKSLCSQTTSIHSSAGLSQIAALASLAQRPFRSPHHNISGVGLIGGGSTPRPGELSLAHHGVCF